LYREVEPIISRGRHCGIQYGIKILSGLNKFFIGRTENTAGSSALIRFVIGDTPRVRIFVRGGAFVGDPYRRGNSWRRQTRETLNKNLRRRSRRCAYRRRCDPLSNRVHRRYAEVVRIAIGQAGHRNIGSCACSIAERRPCSSGRQFIFNDIISDRAAAGRGRSRP